MTCTIAAADIIDSELTNVPIPIDIRAASAGGSGVTSFDNIAIFDELTPLDVDDDFTGDDDDDPDVRLWTKSASTGTVSIQSNKLQFAINNASGTDAVNSRFHISGDFDIQVDFDTSGCPSTTLWANGLLLKAVGGGDTILSIDKRYDVNNYYTSEIKTAGSTNDSDNTTNSDTSGKLRITRSGTTVTCYYWNGSSWTSMSTYASWNTDDVFVQLRLVTTTNMVATATYDNFTINSGTVVWSDTPKKLAFEDGDTGDQCYAEIVTWDATNKSAQLHVKLPTVSAAAPSIINLYYDANHADNTDYVDDTGETASQSVWDNNFKAVYHMAQDPSIGGACILDSTSNVKHLTPTNLTSSNLVDADFGKALSLNDGVTDEYLSVSSDFSAIESEYTLEAYFYLLSYHSAWDIILNVGNGIVGAPLIGLYDTSTNFNIGVGNDNMQANHTSSLSQWYSVASRMSSGIVDLMVDGVLDSITNSVTIATLSAVPLVIGRYNSSGEYPSSQKIREVRISNIVRSDDWIKLTNVLLRQEIVYYGSTPETLGWDLEKGFKLSLPAPLNTLINFPLTTLFGVEVGVNDFDNSAIIDGLIPYGEDAKTVLLLQSDTDDDSIIFEDTSQAAHTVTVNGDVHHEVDQKKFGASAIYFDGTGDFLSIADHVDFEFGSLNFTLDCWVRPTAYPTENSGQYQSMLICKDVLNSRSFTFGLKGTVSSFTHLDFIGFADNTTGYTIISEAYSFSLNTWYHVACVRSGNLIYLFVDGVLLNTGGTAFTRILQNGTSPVKIGANEYDGTYKYYLTGYIDDVRLSKGVARWTETFTPRISAYIPYRDPYKALAIFTETFDQLSVEIEDWRHNYDGSDVVFLLHSDSTDGNTDFTDSSDSGHTITPVGDAHHEVDQKKFGATSVHFDGTTDKLTVPDHSDWDIDTGDFTIDFWVNFTTSVNSQATFTLGTTNGVVFSCFASSTRIYVAGTLNEPGSATSLGFVAGTWSHVAIVRSGTTCKMFVDGVQRASFTASGSILPSVGLVLGYDQHAAGYYLTGYIDEFRVVNGVAKWTEAFTPPTSVHSLNIPGSATIHTRVPSRPGLLDSYTKLLISSDNGDGLTSFTDSSDSAHTVTPSGDAHHEVDQKKFGASSIYFDGTGDWLMIPSSNDFAFLLDDYTIDFWLRFPDVVSTNVIFKTGNADAVGIKISLAATEYLYFRHNGSSTYTNQPLSVNTWYHIAMVNESGTVYLYLNGIKQTNTAIGTTNLAADVVKIGVTYNDTSPFTGYIDELRISKGIARWTENFTPPIAPYAELLTADPVILSLYYDPDHADNDDFVGDIGDTPAQDVWGSHFVFVTHMAQDPSGDAPQILDSTSYAKHGTSYGSMTSGDLIDGATGKMIDLDGTDDFINHGYDAAHNITDTLTLECLFNPNTTIDNSLATFDGLISRNNDPTDSEDTYAMIFNTDGKMQIATTGGNIQSTKASWAAGTEFYAAATYNATGLTGDIFVDGIKETLSNDSYDTMAGSANNLVIGKHADVDFTHVAIGEVRISNIVLSDEWLKQTKLSLTDALITFEAFLTSFAITPTIFSLLYGDSPIMSQQITELYHISAIPKKFVEQYALVEEKAISIPTGWSSRVKLIVDPDKINSTQNGFMALVYLDQSDLLDAVKKLQSNPVRSIAENLRVYIATDGNDNHGDGSADHPYKTVEKGLSMVPEDGQLLLYPGTYNHDAALFDVDDVELFISSTTGRYDDVKIVLGTQMGFLRSSGYWAHIWVENVTIESNCSDWTFYSNDEVMRFYNVFLNYTGSDTSHHWGKGTQVYGGYSVFYNCTIKVGVGDMSEWSPYQLYNSICDDAVDLPSTKFYSCYPGGTDTNINYTTNPPGFPSADSAVILLSSPCVNAGSQSYQSWWDGDNPDMGVHEVGSPYSRLCFTKMDGSLLPVEIIAWDEDNNRAIFYTDIDIDASYNTFVYVYYAIIPISGNSSLLNASNSLSYWSEYESVIHGVINSDGDVEDSAIIGSITTVPTFNDNYYINTPYGPGLNLAYSSTAHLLAGGVFDKTAGTLVVVFNTDNISVTQVLFATPASAITNQHKFEITTTGAIQITDAGGTTSVSTTTGFNDGEYHTLVITWSATGRTVEVDKTVLTISNPTATFAVDPSSAVGLIGYDYVSKDASSDSFDGIISEFRLAKSAFASNLIRTIGYSETDTLFDGTLLLNNHASLPYGAGPKLASFIEEWIITAHVTPNWFVEPWVIMQPPNVQVFEEIWGIKLLNTIVEVWGDVAKKKATFVEWWGDGAVPINWFSELYDDAKQRRAVYSLLWRIHSNPQAFIVENYAITETAIRNFFVENYALKDRNAVLSVKTLLYHLLDEGSTVEQPEASVLVATGSGTTPDVVPDASAYQGLDFVSIQINASLGQYCIFCDVVVPDETQYTWCQYQDAVILSLGGTDYVFFVESRERTISPEKTSYTIGLLSPTAKLDTPYSKTIVDPLNSGTMAKALVETMAALKNVTVDWQILDWMIPGYAISINDETPLAVITKVVNSVGAIVQTKPNGDMLIISKYPVSVPQWPTTTPVAVFTTLEDINQFSETLDVKDGFNAFQITDQGSSSESISLEVVDGEGTAKIVKGYQVPFDVDHPFPLETSGQPGVSIDRYAIPINMQIPIQEEDDDPEWEVVEFIDHVGTTSLPIYEVVEFEWITDDLGDVADLGAFQVSEDGTLSVIDTENVPGESLLRIKYMTKYWQWTVTGPLDRPVQFYVPDSFFQEIGS